MSKSVLIVIGNGSIQSLSKLTQLMSARMIIIYEKMPFFDHVGVVTKALSTNRFI